MLYLKMRWTYVRHVHSNRVRNLTLYIYLQINNLHPNTYYDNVIAGRSFGANRAMLANYI